MKYTNKGHQDYKTMHAFLFCLGPKFINLNEPECYCFMYFQVLNHPSLHGRWKLRRGSPSKVTSLTYRSLKTVEEEVEFCVETGESALNDTISASPDAAINVSMPDLPVDSADTVLNLLSSVEMLEKQVSTLEEKVLQLEKEKEALLARQFSLNKIKGDNAAMLFYTGFPNYEALMSFYNYIEPKVSKMQYWKGEKLLKESQPYQMDKNKIKPGP